ncbi:MAG: PrgI family protein [Patescibacteria group bacterium]|nr:PrgI family protein [Patescibacteria group bacterium]
MQFQVPQFIDTEDKIIGPLTLKQFVYITIGAGLSFFLFFFFNLWLWAFSIVLINTATISLAFIKINGIPLPKIVSAAIGYFWKPKFYLWKKTAAPGQKIEKTKEPAQIKEGANPLNDIWQKLLTSKTPIPAREKTTQPAIFDQFRSHQEKYEVFRKITGEKEMARRVDYK